MKRLWREWGILALFAIGLTALAAIFLCVGCCEPAPQPPYWHGQQSPVMVGDAMYVRVGLHWQRVEYVDADGQPHWRGECSDAGHAERMEKAHATPPHE